MKLTTHCYATLLLIGFGITTAQAQSAYSLHTIEKGETLSMLAKNYHTTVGDIMRLNGMNAQSQLSLGDQIKIPASSGTVERQPQAPAPPKTTPAVAQTHTVATGETLYRISKMYNVPLEKLQAWNNLPDGNVKLGQTLIVSEGTPPPSPAAPAQNTTAEVATPQREVIQSAPVKQQAQPVSQPIREETQQSSAAAYTDNAYTDNYTSVANAPKEGFFTPMYGKNVSSRKEKSTSGEAMTFKSASGWSDKKYYILMNDAPTGSIVKIKNGKNELYAKVLWSLGEMKENEGLSFRVSTAAAAALGITDNKFDLKVSYFE